ALTDLLAEHEFGVGFFYFRKGNPSAALSRFRYTEDTYTTFSGRDRLFFYLGRTYERLGKKTDAATYFAKLRDTYPKSPWPARATKEGRIAVDKQAESR